MGVGPTKTPFLEQGVLLRKPRQIRSDVLSLSPLARKRSCGEGAGEETAELPTEAEIYSTGVEFLELTAY